MGSLLPENNNNNNKPHHTDRVKTGDKAADEEPGSHKDANALCRLTFRLPGRLCDRRERHHRNGIPPAERRAAEQANLQLIKVASLTGAAISQHPIARSDSNGQRQFQAPQASRDYDRFIRNLSICTNSEGEYQDAAPDAIDTANDEPDIHPLRMHPIDNKGQHSRPASTNGGAGVAEVVEEPPEEPETVSVAEASSVPTTNDNNNAGLAEGWGSNNGNTPPPPSDQEDVVADASSYFHSETGSVYAEDWFPFRELSQISWRTADPAPEDETLPPTPKSPYRMGRARRHGWVEGEPF
ncbi:hypothetical protein GX51_01556 [Blastomyces parvus]|uniref:Uncharacterized protein n=1 Tax=Blastomyces parvus TaxID=2060905 RepID=A0A2B7XFC5_9EURO|nr:hypothetical protein GX51_01556 [Blastomyces parvus]